MDIRDKIISNIQSNAQTVLVIPLGEFLSTVVFNYTYDALGKEKYHELIELIKSIYGVSKIFTNDDFNIYSLDDVREINLIYSKIIANIKYLKEFSQHNYLRKANAVLEVIENLKSSYEDLDGKLQKSLSDDEIRSAQSKERNLAQDIYTEADRERAINEIKMRIDEQLKTPIDELLSSEAIQAFLKHIGDKSKKNHYSSDYVLEILKKTHMILSIVSLSSLSFFSRGALESIIENTHELINVLLEIKEFKSQSEHLKNPPDVHHAIKLIDQTRDILKVITGEIDPYVTYLMHEIVTKLDRPSAIEKFNKSKEDYERLSDEVSSTLKSLAERMQIAEKFMQELKEIGDKVGTTSLTEIFTDQSNDLKADSLYWLGAAILVTISVIGFASYLLWFEKPPASTTEALSVMPLRIVILGILITATLWCGRNYRSLRHQSAVNQERAAIIKTFRAFSDDEDDKSVKDRVLTEAIRSVFTPSPSGFVDQSSGRDSNGPITFTNSGNFDKPMKED